MRTVIVTLLLAITGCGKPMQAPRFYAEAVLSQLDDKAIAAQMAIQQAREDAGLPYLQLSRKLQAEAEAHAAAMRAARRLWHKRPPPSGAENIAAGQQTGEEVVGDWMRSPGHRANILGPYSHAGIGRSGTYWCLRLQKRGSAQ